MNTNTTSFWKSVAGLDNVDYGIGDRGVQIRVKVRDGVQTILTNPGAKNAMYSAFKAFVNEQTKKPSRYHYNVNGPMFVSVRDAKKNTYTVVYLNPSINAGKVTNLSVRQVCEQSLPAARKHGVGLPAVMTGINEETRNKAALQLAKVFEELEKGEVDVPVWVPQHRMSPEAPAPAAPEASKTVPAEASADASGESVEDKGGKPEAKPESGKKRSSKK